MNRNTIRDGLYTMLFSGEICVRGAQTLSSEEA